MQYFEPYQLTPVSSSLMQMYDLENLRTNIGTLDLEGGSRTDIKKAGSFNVNEVTRHTDADIRFGKKVSSADKEGVLRQVSQDTAREALKARFNSDKSVSKKDKEAAF